MRKRLYLDERQLRSLIKETVSEYLSETSRRQKAQQAIVGKNHRVKTIAIISAQNPMGSDGSDLPNGYNERAHQDLLKTLKIGHYRYFETPGRYGTPEQSVMIYNISIEDTLFLAYKYNQESVVFVEINGDVISYQYWEGEDHSSPLKKQREEREIVDATNDDDVYTQISKKFKFRIPFFESIKKYEAHLNDRSNYYNVDQLIAECLDNKWSGKHKYYCRGKLNGKLPKRCNISTS